MIGKLIIFCKSGDSGFLIGDFLIFQNLKMKRYDFFLT